MANEKMQREFVQKVQEANGKVLSNRKERARLARKSHKKEVATARWVGMKEMALYLLGPDASCGFCNKPLHNGEIIDADHILSRGRGGKDKPENLRLCHRSCHEVHHGVPFQGDAS